MSVERHWGMLLPFIYFIHQPRLLIKSSSFPTRSPPPPQCTLQGELIILPNVCTHSPKRWRPCSEIMPCFAEFLSVLLLHVKPLLVFFSWTRQLLLVGTGNQHCSGRPHQTMRWYGSARVAVEEQEVPAKRSPCGALNERN